jgi:hypothetical protein
MRDFVENHEAHQDLKLLARLLRYFKPTRKVCLGFLLMIITTFTT